MTRFTMRTLFGISFSFARLGFVLVSTALALPLSAGADDRAPVGAASKPIFWLIPHTHWEGAVFKTREEYLEMGLPHILTALRLLKENPDYRFVLDQVAYFKPFLERYPEESDSFRKFVAEGRLQIVGGLNVMPDDNMPSGESFIRQLLYAKGYCREALHTEVTVGWLIDTFGHHAQMPQLLRLAGYRSFWFSRGVANRSTMPSEFQWEGLDGTRIPAFWLPFFYGYLYGPPKDQTGFAAFMRERWDALAPFSHGGDRVGLAGVDVSDPELHVPALVSEFNAPGSAPFVLRIGVPTQFEHAKANDALPVLTGERNPLFQGIYSSRIELKQRMRETERLLTTAEEFGAFGALLGGKVDTGPALRAWEPALFNVTHDLASGVMTDHVYEDTIRGYDAAKRAGDEMVESGLRNTLAHIDTRGAGCGVVVFNTLGWSRTDIASANVGFAEGGVTGFDLLDSAGHIVPAQLEEVDRFEDGGLRRIKFMFVARDIPAVGYAVYHVVPRHGAARAEPQDGAVTKPCVLENEFYKMTVDPGSGALSNLTLKADGWDSLIGAANVVALEQDNGDFWELYHNLDGAQNVVMTRPLKAPQTGQAHFSTDEFAQTPTLCRGNVFSEIRTEHPFGANGYATVIRLYQGIPRVDFETTIVNRERFVRYRLLTPTSIRDGRNFQEIPFGAIERPMAQEFPAQNWIDLSDGDHGMSLLNRGLPGNNVDEGTMMLSLLRSTRIQSYGIGGGFEGQGSDSGLELGAKRTFSYALVPHAGDWRRAKAYRAGLEFNHPLVVHSTGSHAGNLPARWGLMEVSPANVVLSALKLSNDGSMVLRVYEANGEPAKGASVSFNGKVRSAFEANLMEDPIARAKCDQDVVRFDLHRFEIKTFKVKLASRR